jgi:beta-glucosidase
MTLTEKVSQLYGVWVGIDATAGDVAPHQHELVGELDWAGVIEDGIGQLTRPFGTAPVEPAHGVAQLAKRQREIVAANRFGIPATVHEECLTGLNAWQATVFPSPLCWAASFDPALVEQMTYAVGRTMRRIGIHQGLAPVLDVVRDPRWGRVEETMGEDPYLVGLIGSAYVRGLERAGVVATLKHFVGYSASRAGRNLGPVSVGPRELADVLVPPFEAALRAGARSVMNSYNALDGVPTAADGAVLTGLLRDELGFTGTVVSDYFSVAFLESLHGVADSAAAAAVAALGAGLDVELPSVSCFGEPLLEAAAEPDVAALVDRAVTRVLLQKAELGMLDEDWCPEPEAHGTEVDLDDAESRSVARAIAARSIVLLQNDGTLPLAPGRRLAVVGPRAHTPQAMLGCYSFPMHVGVHHPSVPTGIAVSTLLDALAADRAGWHVTYAAGCPVTGGDDPSGDELIAGAVRAAAGADVCVVALGDQAGLFGLGTSGEGCDAADLRLPGRQEELLEALLGTGTPVVAVLLVGRPYDLSRQADRLAAVLCGFFPGEEGGPALADVIAGRVDPSGRLPVSFPGGAASQPTTYLTPLLGARSEVSSVDPTPLFPFGHGLSYAPAVWEAVDVAAADWPVDGTCELEVTLSNPSPTATSEVVQVYLHDPVAEVDRPVQLLVGAARVDLPARSRASVRLSLHADLASYTGRDLRRIVEPGDVELRVGASSCDVRETLKLRMTGERRYPGRDRRLHAEVRTTVEQEV